MKYKFLGKKIIRFELVKLFWSWGWKEKYECKDKKE